MAAKKAVNPEALRDQATETVLNTSNLGDSGSFLVNGSLRCLVAYLQPYGIDQWDISFAKINVFFVVYV